MWCSLCETEFLGHTQVTQGTHWPKWGNPGYSQPLNGEIIYENRIAQVKRCKDSKVSLLVLWPKSDQCLSYPYNLQHFAIIPYNIVHIPRSQIKIFPAQETQEDITQHCLLIYHPLTYRSTCPAERSRMWEDTGRGRPFLSQLSCGGGEPVATHSMLTELSRTVINFSTVSPLPSITGGTGGADGERGQCCENKLKRQGEIQLGETVCILKCFKPTIDI